VTTVNLAKNQISVEGSRELARLIPDANLMRIEIDGIHPELKEALNLNYQILILTPFFAAALNILPNSEKNKYYNLKHDEITKENGPLRYAGGILMKEELPKDVRRLILSYFPLTRDRAGYRRLLNEKYPNDLNKGEKGIAEITRKVEKMKM
jgi:hypothetical protein